jgi:hypothetical protein
LQATALGPADAFICRLSKTNCQMSVGELMAKMHVETAACVKKIQALDAKIVPGSALLSPSDFQSLKTSSVLTSLATCVSLTSRSERTGSGIALFRKYDNLSDADALASLESAAAEGTQQLSSSSP